MVIGRSNIFKGYALFCQMNCYSI